MESKKNVMDALESLPPEEQGALLDSGEQLPDEETAPEKKTQSQLILDEVFNKNITLFITDLKETYIRLFINNHYEIRATSDREFKDWLVYLYFGKYGKVPQPDAVNQALNVLSAKARFEGKQIPLQVRIARQEDNIWYDLSDEGWQAVKINKHGWGIEDHPPILFKRYAHQLSQDIPERGGDINNILKYINLKGEYNTLFLVYLVSCYIPNIPHPIPIFYGSQGSAKTTTNQIIKRLVDNSKLDALKLPGDINELIRTISRHWWAGFDNVSYVSPDVSDELCKAVTGAGTAKRALYTNDDDIIFTYQHCISLNGINCVATRPDLLDRSILFELDRITESGRQEINEIWESFAKDKPYILGGIFDTVSKATGIYPTVKLAKKSRLADFETWGYAIGEALGGKGDEFLSQYRENRAVQNDEAINSNPVATLVMEFMKDRDEWEGMTNELLAELTESAPALQINTRGKGFPTQPNILANMLNRLKDTLERGGIEYIKGKHTRTGTPITLRSAGEPSQPSQPSQPSNGAGLSGDDKNVSPSHRHTSPSHLEGVI